MLHFYLGLEGGATGTMLIGCVFETAGAKGKLPLNKLKGNNEEDIGLLLLLLLLLLFCGTGLVLRRLVLFATGERLLGAIVLLL